MGVPQKFNIGAELVDRNLREGRADRTAIWFEGNEITYAQLAERVDRMAAALLRAGVEPEQRVLFIMPDSPELAALYLATIKIGAVAVPCNPQLRPGDYAYFLEETRARLLVTSTACLERVEPAIAGQRNLRRTVVAGLDGKRGLNAFLEGDEQKVETAPTSREEPAFWLWTSGSTGRPKAAVHLHQDWTHCCELYAKGVLGISENDRCYSASKLFHAYGLGNALAFPFWVGASAVLSSEKPAPELVFQTISEAKPTLFFGVPTLYASMLQVKDLETRYDVRSVRLCVSAGESLPADLFTRWRKKIGPEILDGIGSTEVLHIYLSPRPGKAIAGSTGLPVDGYEVRLLDELGAAVKFGETGDLVVRGPSTALYYWNRRDQTRSKMRGDWFFSGDKFRQTEEGEYHYVGRSDDMFKTGGEWVSPADVEAALVSHETVLECAVVAKRSEDGLLRPQAHVVLINPSAGTPALAEELRQHVRSRLAGYMVPKEIVFAADLPKTSTGKIQRYVLRGEQQ